MANSFDVSVNDYPPVELLLATFNSERFLPQLLDSLLTQTHDDFVLVISDDCSADRTISIIDKYGKLFRHPIDAWQERAQVDLRLQISPFY